MGLTLSPYITTIPSENINKDVQLLREAFPACKFTCDDDGPRLEGSEVILLESSMERGIVLQSSNIVGAITPIWTIRDCELEPLRELASGQETILLSNAQSCHLLTLELPGGSTLICLTSNTFGTKEGRQWYARARARCLARRSIVSGSEPESISETQSERLPNPATERSIVPTTEVGSCVDPLKVEDSPPPVPSITTTPKLPDFPTLDVKLLHGDSYLPFPTNSPTPVPFETDLFKGQMLLILRPSGDPAVEDPYWNERIFSKRKRRVVFQLQGKFKRKPEGNVYAGGEISDPMKLGLLGKGMCNILLGLIQKVVSSVHYSFGDKKEMAHIVVPAYSFFERLAVTKPGEQVPPMGETFPESKESIAQRKAGMKGDYDWNTQDTYSMSYHSMYFDLPSWQVVKVPVTPDLDLSSFWGKSSLSVVLYENTTTPPTGRKEQRHLQGDNRYFFSMKLQHFPDGNKSDESNDSLLPKSLPWNNTFKRVDSSMDLSVAAWARDEASTIGGGSAIMEEVDIVEEADHDDENESQFFFDADELPEELVSSARLSSASSVDSVHDQLSRIDAVCPMWIEMCSKGKYSTAYAFNVEGARTTVFRSGSTAAEFFDMASASRVPVESDMSPRLSSHERMRRVLGHALSTSLVSVKLTRFKAKWTDFDEHFLQREIPTQSERRTAMTRKSCFVARAISDRHWIEEWAKLTDRHLSFYHPDRLQKSNFRLTLQSILKVEKMSPTEHNVPNMPKHHFLEVQTIGRTVYLMFATELLRNEWYESLRPFSKSRGEGGGGSVSSIASSTENFLLWPVDDPTEEFLHKSSMWSCKQRRILNCRKFSFRSRGNLTRNPNKAVADALRKALEPQSEEAGDETKLIPFLDSAAMLKDVNVDNLTDEKQRLAFFINLYHVMIMHAFMVLGPPDSTFKWISYFNTIAYQCSDDVFSLTELEHNIIRASMNYPSQFVSKFVLPKSRFRFALQETLDYRINFALNAGSLSNPASVPVYQPDLLDRQLDSTARAYLEASVQVNAKRSTTVVTLPRVCQWFADDFAKNGSTNRLLSAIEPLLSDRKRRGLNSCWSATERKYVDVTVKYLSYSFECRPLTLLDG